ncbi:hypothetical protein Pelo_18310 [Pelomyxa schiedti]|nr:hypothetical protein Pelo_18310 [Pelomyxa schiedti]
MQGTREGAGNGESGLVIGLNSWYTRPEWSVVSVWDLDTGTHTRTAQHRSGGAGDLEVERYDCGGRGVGESREQQEHTRGAGDGDGGGERGAEDVAEQELRREGVDWVADRFLALRGSDPRMARDRQRLEAPCVVEMGGREYVAVLRARGKDRTTTASTSTEEGEGAPGRGSGEGGVATTETTATTTWERWALIDSAPVPEGAGGPRGDNYAASGRALLDPTRGSIEEAPKKGGCDAIYAHHYWQTPS